MKTQFISIRLGNITIEDDSRVLRICRGARAKVGGVVIEFHELHDQERSAIVQLFAALIRTIGGTCETPDLTRYPAAELP